MNGEICLVFHSKSDSHQDLKSWKTNKLTKKNIQKILFPLQISGEGKNKTTAPQSLISLSIYLHWGIPLKKSSTLLINATNPNMQESRENRLKKILPRHLS